MKTTHYFLICGALLFLFTSTAVSYAEPSGSPERDAKLLLAEIEQKALVEQYHHLLMETFKLRLARQSKEIEVRHSGDESSQAAARRLFAIQEEQHAMLERLTAQVREEMMQLSMQMAELKQVAVSPRQLNGQWAGHDMENDAAVKLVIDGKKARLEVPSEGVWFEGEFIVESEGEKFWEVAFRIQRCAEEKYQGKTSRGLVKLEGNRLMLAANEPGNPARPSDLKPSHDTKVFVFEKE